MTIHCGPYTATTSVESKLGGGTYGTVYLGKHEDSGVPVAIKLFHFQGNPKVTEVEVEVYEKTRSCSLKHPPFAQFFSSSAAPFRVIVLEVFEQDLGAVPLLARPQVTMVVAKQVLRGLVWLHQEYVHCDLKPANILWTTVGQRIALADFGSCQRIGSLLDDVCCTPNYRPPELLKSRKPWAGQTVHPSIDIWSYACTMWEFCMDKLFFPQHSKQQLEASIEAFALQHRKGRFDLWHNRMHRAGAWGMLVEKCMQPIAKQRPTAQHILAHTLQDILSV